MNLNQVTVPALDVAASVDFYRRLGLDLIVSAPHYARFRCPEGDATFSVHRAPAQVVAAGGVVVYFEVSRLDETVEALQGAGISFLQEPRDEPWLWREARLTDPSGNLICLYRAGVNRLNPPWRVRGDDGPGRAQAAAMDSFEFTVGDCGSIDRFLAERIYEFNVQATSYADGESFAAVKRDPSGTIVAGVSGYTWGGCCHVSHLWVSEPLRAQGLGRALLLATEAHAANRGCKIILLASHSFQSPAFYEGLDYVRQASIADHPLGHENIVLAKRLA
jgi:catechol 2,3-dioxygenase-like lactoylglutathione lyase family enzyme/GNAT superfamily N-acetyltransferase